MESRLTNWLLAQRSSPRLAFLLQIACRALTSICSLLWVPLLLRSMGQALNGLLLTFQSITSMGGAGGLGDGRVGQHSDEPNVGPGEGGGDAEVPGGSPGVFRNHGAAGRRCFPAHSPTIIALAAF